MTTLSPGLIAEPLGFEVVAFDLPGGVDVLQQAVRCLTCDSEGSIWPSRARLNVSCQTSTIGSAATGRAAMEQAWGINKDWRVPAERVRLLLES